MQTISSIENIMQTRDNQNKESRTGLICKCLYIYVETIRSEIDRANITKEIFDLDYEYKINKL